MDKALAAGRNVIDFFAIARRKDGSGYPFRPSASYCCHCGGWLAEGESEDDCSSAGLTRSSAPHPAPPSPLRAVRG